MEELFFDLKYKEHPYPLEVNSSYELWGNIKLIYKKETETIILIDYQWDILEVCNWFLENKNALMNEAYPFFKNKNQSIAESRDILYSKNDFKSDSEEEEYFTKLENYFSHHYFKLRGTPTPLFFIGIIGQKAEISRYDKETSQYLLYQFEMENFLSSTEGLLKKLLATWLIENNGKNFEIMERLKRMEEEYNVKLC